MTTESWRSISGFEDLYEVALPDKVRSLDRIVPQNSRWGHTVNKTHRGRELTPYVCENGRQRVILHADGHRYCRYIDDLVREAFGGTQ